MAFSILVVDDNADILANVSDYLTMRGWSVESCTTSADAWERLSARQIDLLVLDVGLPGMDGVSLCRRIRISNK